jgi:Cd2+/Zn2+-exporting ATPase
VAKHRLCTGSQTDIFALALSGHASLWMAVFADTGTSLLVVLNGVRLSRYAGKDV